MSEVSSMNKHASYTHTHTQRKKGRYMYLVSTYIRMKNEPTSKNISGEFRIIGKNVICVYACTVPAIAFSMLHFATPCGNGGCGGSGGGGGGSDGDARNEKCIKYLCWRRAELGCSRLCVMCVRAVCVNCGSCLANAFAIYGDAIMLQHHLILQFTLFGFNVVSVTCVPRVCVCARRRRRLQRILTLRTKSYATISVTY